MNDLQSLIKSAIDSFPEITDNIKVEKCNHCNNFFLEPETSKFENVTYCRNCLTRLHEGLNIHFKNPLI